MIAGIAKTLSANRYMKNCLNEGDIILANYVTRDTTAFTGNAYLSGLVNVNHAGDLQDQDESTRWSRILGLSIA